MVFSTYVDLRSHWVFSIETGKHYYIYVVHTIFLPLVPAVLWNLCCFHSIIVPMVYYCGGKFYHSVQFLQIWCSAGGGPANLPAKYHTVIELPGSSRKRSGTSSKRSPLGWKSFFSKSGRKNSEPQQHKASTPSDSGTNQVSVVASFTWKSTDLKTVKLYLWLRMEFQWGCSRLVMVYKMDFSNPVDRMVVNRAEVNVMLCFLTTHCTLRLIVQSELDVPTFATRHLHVSPRESTQRRKTKLWARNDQ